MEVATSEVLRVERDAGVATLTLNRPGQRNALSTELMRRVIDALAELREQPEVGAVVIAGAGPAFSAGHDLSELAGTGTDVHREVVETCTRMMTAIHELPQPVVARVHGIATAAGCQLVAACDLAIASSTATFATPGVKIGLFCSTPMVELSRAVGRKRAMEMLLTGMPVDAATAAEWGLVNRVVEPDALDAAVRELTDRLTSASTLTLEIGKQAFYAQIDLDLAGAYAHCGDVIVRNAAARDAQEGMSAFLEKRTPQWEGR